MSKILIKQANLVNEGCTQVTDVLIAGDRIEKIAQQISDENALVIDAQGLYLLPGMIDDQVHFREPGLTHKGNIYSESKAALAGGITSIMDMPNTIPNTLSLQLLEEKYAMASQSSFANYSFFMGINKDNLEEALRTDSEKVCGITDDGLYFNSDEGILANYPDFLEKLFARTNTLVALHSEDDAIIRRNTDRYRKLYREDIPFQFHPAIRSTEACVEATKRVLAIARKHNNRLHLFHISTAEEADMFDNKTPVHQKRITAEACIHHLWFSDKDYEKLGAKMKWNPAIKSEFDKVKILAALLEDKLDIVATDHAPHTIAEKSGNYFKALSGGPLVQHALPVLLELYHQGSISLEKIVEKTSHNVALIYKIIDRGFIREGYFADLVLVDLASSWRVNNENTLYQCGWSPFENQVFRSRIVKTFVNGNLVYDKGNFNENKKGSRLQFSKNR
jgi:dihydroorotase